MVENCPTRAVQCSDDDDDDDDDDDNEDDDDDDDDNEDDDDDDLTRQAHNSGNRAGWAAEEKHSSPLLN